MRHSQIFNISLSYPVKMLCSFAIEMQKYDINSLTCWGEKGYQNLTPEIASGGDIRGGGISPTLLSKCLAIVTCPIIGHR